MNGPVLSGSSATIYGPSGGYDTRIVVHHEAASVYATPHQIEAVIVVCKAALRPSSPTKKPDDTKHYCDPLYIVRLPETLTPEGLQRTIQLLQEVQTRVPAFEPSPPEVWA